MPSQRPSAAFEPLPPDLDLPALVEETPNFEYVTRVSCEMIEQQSMEAFEKLVLLHVIIGGKPLVIDGFQQKLDGWTFGSQWLHDNCGHKFEQARNLIKQQNMPLSISHYLKNMSKLTNQWDSSNYKDLDRQRIYLKDIDCPELWHHKLEEQLPAGIFYMNDNTGDIAGPGSRDEHHKGFARAGDLMSSLPSEMRAENLMCYIGHEGTYTPAHREMCASLGQNLMVETSGAIDNDGKPTKPGSSIWFMTETNDRHLVSEYWLSTLGHDIEIEKHFAQINAWKAAPFTTYIVEQKVGDFILIPPLAPHQVWNRGTRTMKVAWNRTTVETLEMALHEALPRARMVCRDEQYKNKAIIYFTLDKYSALLKEVDLQILLTRNQQALENLRYSTKIRQLQKDFKRLYALFTEVLLSETLAPVSPNEKKGQYLPFEGFITCSYCRCNIFNRFLTCTSCIISDGDSKTGEEDTYDICMDCFVMGRSCNCISGYKWVEQFPWQDLTQKHEQWRQQIINFEGGLNEKSPQSLQAERKSLDKKTLAQVCQEQLKIRPWSDPKNPLQAMTFKQRQDLALGKSPKNAQTGDDEDSGDEEQSPKKKNTTIKRKDRLSKDFAIEHVSLYPLEKWKVALCSRCDRSYSYGTLWRGFDMMPLTVMEQKEWLCPFCRKNCSCGACRRRTGMVPYEPKGTVLGHDTSKVADPRSAEHLISFSHSNVKWLNNAGAADGHPLESRRLNERIEEAERAKAQDPALDENYVDEESHISEIQNRNQSSTQHVDVGIPIDPMLSASTPLHGPVAAGDHQSRQRPAARTNGHLSGEGADVTNSDDKGAADAHPNAASSEREDQRHLNFVSNGITYEYPDPEENTQPLPLSHAIDMPDVSQVKKRKTKDIIVESDAYQERGLHSNKVFHQAQDQQALIEARENDRYIIAEAALSGKTLRVKLSLPSSSLAAVACSHPRSDHVNDQEAGSNTAKELLRSNVRTTVHDGQEVRGAKKRKAKIDDMDDVDDGDFTVRKRRGRLPKAAGIQSSASRQARKQRPSIDESHSHSESNEEVTPAAGGVRRAGEPRSLPKYLARRNENPDVPDGTQLRNTRRKSVPDAQSLKATRSSHTSDMHGDSRPGKSPLNAKTSSARTQPLSVQQMALAAQQLAEENRKAKLKAVSWADAASHDPSSSDRSPSSDDDRGAQQSTQTKASALLAVPTSMFSRPGMVGRKFKVASAKSSSQGVKS